MQASHAYAFPSLHRTQIFFAPCSLLCSKLHREFSCFEEGFGNEVATILQILIFFAVCR